ncbi:MAG TPA: type II secretion system F family protein [Thermoflexia bacterium]|nr:type II secretion system F family protein [Thermoflexia bacterium]
MLYLFGGIFVVAVGILIFALRGGKPAGQDLLEERIGESVPSSRATKKSKDKSSVIGAAIDRAVKGRGFTQDLSTQLARAGWKVTVGEFIVLSVTIGLGASLLLFLLGRALLIPVGILLGVFGPRIYVGMRKNKRLKTFNGQLGDALNLMVNSLRAGYSVLQAMEVISQEMPQPIAEEFGRVVLEIQLGVNFDVAMGNLLRRMPSADLDLLITAMSVQREVGGNLAEVLDAISFTIRERVRIKGEIKALTAQGKATGTIITILPFALVILISLINPGFIGPLYQEPCGWAMLGVSFVLIVIGYVIIGKITDIEV